MAEETKAAKPAPSSSGGLRTLVVILILMILSAGGGMALYRFVIGPKLDGEKEAAPPEGAIPAEAVAVDFEEAQAAVQNPDPNSGNTVLLYAMSMICANEDTKEFVEKNKQWFVAMLAELHRNRTKDELNDTAVQKSILELAKEQANSLLRRLQPKPDPEVKVIQVLYLKFTVFSL